MTTSSDRSLSPLLAWGFLLAGLGVMIGAFGAHALAPHVSPGRLETFKTGQSYHLFASLALVGLGIVDTLAPRREFRVAGWLVGCGLAVFAGTLYLLAVTGMRWLGAVTPLGGVLMIGGLVLASVTLFRLGRRGPEARGR
jgi:uncharacterized membrane protein YgdD (TMEM256/DUF423 family)